MTNEIELTWEELSVLGFKRDHHLEMMQLSVLHPERVRAIEIGEWARMKSGPINIVDEFSIGQFDPNINLSLMSCRKKKDYLRCEDEKKQEKCPLCGCDEICYITKFGEPDYKCSNCDADWPYLGAEEL